MIRETPHRRRGSIDQVARLRRVVEPVPKANCLFAEGLARLIGLDVSLGKHIDPKSDKGGRHQILN